MLAEVNSMAQRKLISCIGYSLRMAIKLGHDGTAEHLWHGLYAASSHEVVRTETKKLSLFSALGLDQSPEIRSQSDTSLVKIEASNERWTNRSQDPHRSSSTSVQVAIEQSDEATQTVEDMLPMSEFAAFLERLQKDLEKNLTERLGASMSMSESFSGNPGSSSSPPVPHQGPCDGAGRGIIKDSFAGPPSVSATAPPAPVHAGKHHRRELRRHQLELRTGLG